MISDVFCGGGQWDNEIGWTLTCQGVDAPYVGDAPYRKTITLVVPTTCVLVMTDAYGDGWNGASWSGLGHVFDMENGATKTVTLFVT